MEEIDLFSQWETLPKEVLDVMTKYGTTETYEDCRVFIYELEKIGYTCDFDMLGECYGLKKL